MIASINTQHYEVFAVAMAAVLSMKECTVSVHPDEKLPHRAVIMYTGSHPENGWVEKEVYLTTLFSGSISTKRWSKEDWKMIDKHFPWFGKFFPEEARLYGCPVAYKEREKESAQQAHPRLEEAKTLMSAHRDPYYSFSDSLNCYKAGEKQYQELLVEGRAMGLTNEVMNEAWKILYPTSVK